MATFHFKIIMVSPEDHRSFTSHSYVATVPAVSQPEPPGVPETAGLRFEAATEGEPPHPSLPPRLFAGGIHAPRRAPHPSDPDRHDPDLHAPDRLRDRPVVLVVDDEESYRAALTVGLAREGFSVVVAATGREALRMFCRRPDVVLLDLMLPDISGIELCQELRRIAPVPIIMVSARDEEVDVVLGLEFGAADYVTKPFRLLELSARIRAVLRRETAGGHPVDEVIEAGPVCLDTGKREVLVSGRPIELSRKEFDLLALLVSRAQRVVTREVCIDRLWWERDLADSRTLDTHVKRLRRKIEPDPSHPRHIVTVRGVGFRFEP